MRRFGLSVLLGLATASPLSAQRLEETRVAMHVTSTELAPAHHSTTSVAPSRTSASTGAMITGGIIGGVMGAFAGSVVGRQMENCPDQNVGDCGIGGAVLGGLIGEAVGVPMGVNWAANGNGTLRKTIPVSLGVSAACLVMGFMTGGASILMIPPMQIYTAIRAERSGSTGFLSW